MWGVVFALWVGLSPGLTVETATPDALCPDLPATRRAVEARLGVVTVDGSRGWTARTTMGHAPGAEASDFVRLELFDPGGERKLQRDLPLGGEPCATMAQVVALVLERYFRGIGWSSGAPLPSEGEPDAAGSAPVVTAPRRDARDDSAGPTPLALRVAGGVSAPDTSAAVEIGVRVALSARLVLGLSALLPPATRTEALSPESLSSSPRAQMWALPLRLALDVTTRDRFALSAGPELFASIDHAETSRLNPNTSSTRVVLGAGVAVSAGWQLTSWLAAGVRAAIDYALPLPMSRFEVDVTTNNGVQSHEVLPPRALQGLLTGGVTIGIPR